MPTQIKGEWVLGFADGNHRMLRRRQRRLRRRAHRARGYGVRRRGRPRDRCARLPGGARVHRHPCAFRPSRLCTSCWPMADAWTCSASRTWTSRSRATDADQGLSQLPEPRGGRGRSRHCPACRVHRGRTAAQWRDDVRRTGRPRDGAGSVVARMRAAGACAATWGPATTAGDGPPTTRAACGAFRIRTAAIICSRAVKDHQARPGGRQRPGQRHPGAARGREPQGRHPAPYRAGRVTNWACRWPRMRATTSSSSTKRCASTHDAD